MCANATLNKIHRSNTTYEVYASLTEEEKQIHLLTQTE